MSYYFNPHAHQCPWYPYAELMGYSSTNWCEKVSCYWISSPIGTYSALAIVFIAVALFSRLKKKNHPDLKFFLNLFIGVGLGASFYHISLNYLSQLIAHGFMYAFLSAIILKNLIRQGRVNYSQKNKTFFIFTFSFLLIEHILYVNFLPTQIVLPFVFILFLISEFMCKKFEEIKLNYKMLFISIFLYVIAEGFSYLDLYKIACQPQSNYYQGHALWHLFLGLSFSAIFLHIFQVYPAKEVEKEIDFDTYQLDEDKKAPVELDSIEDEEEDDQLNDLQHFDDTEDDADPDLIEEEFDDSSADEAEEQTQFEFDDSESESDETKKDS